jgi:hypothetical protein
MHAECPKGTFIHINAVSLQGHFMFVTVTSSTYCIHCLNGFPIFKINGPSIPLNAVVGERAINNLSDLICLQICLLDQQF